MKKQIDGLIHRTMWISIALFVLRALISWESVRAETDIYALFGFAGEAIGVAAIIMVCYEKWIWRVDPLVKIPYIAGKYKGSIKSTYNQEIKEASLIIKQSLLSVEVTLNTDESESRSISGSVEEVLGKPELIYTYLNEPTVKAKDKSSIHHGTATFIISDKRHLIGQYYTDRNTAGDMDFIKESK